MRTCQGCDAQLPVQAGPGRPRKWCAECKRTRVWVVRPKAPAARTCERERCGEPLPPGIKRHARFCSRECQKRAHDEAIVASCPGCGKGMTRANVRKLKGECCQDCRHVGMRRGWEARASIIADLWADGLTVRQIGAEFGWSKNQMGVEIARIRQWRPELLPHRRSPQDVANIRAGYARALAKRGKAA